MNSIKTRKTFNVIPKNEAPNLLVFNSCPVLWEHRDHEMLKGIWDGIKDGDIITNRAAKRSLAKQHRNEAIEEKCVMVHGCQKRIYLIWRVEEEFVSEDLMYRGSQAAATLFQNPSENPYSIYRYMKRYNKDLGCTEHYTCEIDGFLQPQGEPIEFKSSNPPENKKFYLPGYVKVNHVLQCQLSGIDKIVYGVIKDSTMHLRYSKVNEMESGVHKGVKEAYAQMDANMKKLVEHHKYSLKHSWW